MVAILHDQRAPPDFRLKSRSAKRSKTSPNSSTASVNIASAVGADSSCGLMTCTQLIPLKTCSA